MAFRSGYISITGRPNVGKSTFLNKAIGQKLAIVTSRPQTTRNRILGILTAGDSQLVFIDTPGIHRPKHGLGAHMVKEARSAIHDVDIVLLMVEPHMPGAEEREIIETLKGEGVPVVLAINKADKVRKQRMLPVIQAYAALHEFDSVVPISALTGDGVDIVLARLRELVPEGGPLYPEDMVTDQMERSMVAEIVREKAMRATDEEVPHAIATELMQWSEHGDIVHIDVDIYVEKTGQKGIIIGKNGAMLKKIGTEARREVEDLLGRPVFLKLFVKVEENWRTRRSVLSDLGFK